ncbi:MAG TPA: TlpA disulfide reductase family protein [Bryobacteraceae bacterium]|jgi:thiol-disulfide isomerase/thioredoxin
MRISRLLPSTLVLAGALSLFAQYKPENAPSAEDAEQRELSNSLAEAGNSPIDLVRVLEQHLNKYPHAHDRDKLERALVSAAIEAKDDRRTVLWGEHVLVKTPKDVQVLQKVASALLTHEDRESAEKGYSYAHRLELELTDERKQDPPENLTPFRWQFLVDRRLADSYRLQARAEGILGKSDEAIDLARRSYELNPTAAGAREWGRWLAANGKTLEAVERYADAFTMEDPDSNEADRASDRQKLADLYRKLHKSEKGLGDLVLQAYDRTYALTSARMARIRQNDPNAQAKAVLDFTLPAVKGEPLKMQSLKGKTVVLDFWATWCQPCRIQRPMYEEVERSFSSNPNVVFLSVNADEDQSKVAPFVASQKWTQPVYFDAGLGAMLKVGSIPTTIVLNREGQIVSRMTGFIPDRFIDMLTSRIKESLSE